MNGINYLIAQGRPAPTFDYLKSQSNALALQRETREAQEYPEERNWLREKRGMERSKFQLEQEAEDRRKEFEPMTNLQQSVEFLRKIEGMITPKNYDDTLVHLKKYNKIGGFPSMAELQQMAAKRGIQAIGPDGNFTSEFEDWFDQKKKEFLNVYEQKAKTFTPEKYTTPEGGIEYVEPKAGLKVAPGLKPYEKPTGGQISPLGKLIGEYNALSPNDPNKKFYLGAIKKQAESTGFTIDVDKDGNVRIIQGPIGSEQMTKPMQAKIQEKLFNSTEQMARLKGIEVTFKPEFQEWETRLGTTWSSIKAKAGKDLSPEDTKKLTEFSAYKRKSLENINNYIKEITGAQMSEAEANRLRQASPDPGEGIFGGDDPISFKSKLDDVIKQTKLSIIRYQMLLKQGMTPDLIKNLAKSDNLPTFDKARDFINQRGKEIEQKFSSQLSGNELKLRVAQELNKEFGL